MIQTALLHYWLTNMRGGENVFREICGMFPGGEDFGIVPLEMQAAGFSKAHFINGMKAVIAS